MAYQPAFRGPTLSSASSQPSRGPTSQPSRAYRPYQSAGPPTNLPEDLPASLPGTHQPAGPTSQPSRGFTSQVPEAHHSPVSNATSQLFRGSTSQPPGPTSQQDNQLTFQIAYQPACLPGATSQQVRQPTLERAYQPAFRCPSVNKATIANLLDGPPATSLPSRGPPISRASSQPSLVPIIDGVRPDAMLYIELTLSKGPTYSPGMHWHPMHPTGYASGYGARLTFGRCGDWADRFCLILWL